MTGRKEEFVPDEDGRVRIYVCGVTPYSDTHIGHARPSIFWDVVRRYLEYRGFRVFLVQNFTDVDDKVIARAQALGVDPLKLSRALSDEYLTLMDLLGVRRADVHPRVSDHIEDIIRVTEGLIQRGAAYASEGNVWFDVSRFPGYGKLSRRSVEELRTGSRGEVDPTKRNPADFALWKRAKPGEPSWPSPWGPGRPGWHIECSAMALKYLGPGFDFHGGGIDLIFPHHENEIAQSEVYADGRTFCRYWLHHEMLNLRGEKMSKSLGNIVTMREALGRAPAGAIRLMLLGAHYRKPLDFDFELLDENHRAWKRLNESVERLREAYAGRVPALGTPAETPAALAPTLGVGKGGPGASAGGREAADGREAGAGNQEAGSGNQEAGSGNLGTAAAEARRKFETAMDDDFNTAGALAALFDLARQANARLAGEGAGEVRASDLRAALGVMEELGRGVLGVVAEEGTATRGAAGAGAGHAARLVDILVEVRDRLRQDRQFALSDFIRDALLELGYELRDSSAGTLAKRRN